MRILQAFDFMSPQKGGGTVDVISKLSKVLVDRGHEVTICTSDLFLDRDYIKSIKGVKLEIYHNKFSLLGLYYTPELLKLNITKYDIIHFHCYRSFQDLVLGMKAVRYHVPYIIDAHGSANLHPRFIFKLAFDQVFKTIINNTSKFVAETNVGKQEYIHLGIKPDKISIIHPPLDLTEFDNLPLVGTFRGEYHIPIDTYLVLYVGRIHKDKGLEFLVESINHINRFINNLMLVIIGEDDGYKSNLERFIHNRNLDNKVLFTGYRTGVGKTSAYVDADVLVQSAPREQGARPALEAVMCGTPVIGAYGTGAGEDISKLGAGILVKYGDIPRLSQVIVWVSELKLDLQSQISNSREYIRNHYSINRISTEYESLYKEITK